MQHRPVLPPACPVRAACRRQPRLGSCLQEDAGGRSAWSAGCQEAADRAASTTSARPRGEKAVLTLCAGRPVVQGEVALLRECAGRGVDGNGAVVELDNVENRIRHPGCGIQTRELGVKPEKTRSTDHAHRSMVRVTQS